MSEFSIRKLTAQDLDAVVAIETQITKGARIDLLRQNIAQHLEHGDPQACLAAESKGKVVGFIIGDARPWEFGAEETVAWIKIIGVDPEHQGTGIGKALGERLLEHFRNVGIKRVRTLSEWDSSDLVAYFKALGFHRSDYIALERKL